MPEDINPFEPWRPPQPPPIPPVTDRELFRERDSDAERPDWYRAANEVPPEQGSGGTARAVLVAATVLLVLAIVLAGARLGGTHLTRLAAAGGVLWVSVVLARAAGRRLIWRLGWVAAGFGGGVACWYLVPTVGGVSLLQARHRLDALLALPPGDLAGFTAGQSDRAGLRLEFPTWKADVDRAEASWARQTAALVVAEADRLSQGDPDAALDHLRQAQAALHDTAHTVQARQDLAHAHHQVVQSLLDRAERDLDDLLRKRRFAAFHQRADETIRRLGPVAAEVGLEATLSAQMDRLRIRSVRRQIDLASERLTRLLEQKDYIAVAREGRRAWTELGELARPLHLDVSLESAIQPLREKALQARLTEGRKSLDQLIAKKDYVAVATHGQEAHDALQEEAGAVGANKMLRATLIEARQVALRARLDGARKEALALLAKKRYQAVGAAGDRAVREMAAEASTVGCTAELQRFRESCGVFADLAKKAAIEDRK